MTLARIASSAAAPPGVKFVGSYCVYVAFYNFTVLCRGLKHGDQALAGFDGVL